MRFHRCAPAALLLLLTAALTATLSAQSARPIGEDLRPLVETPAVTGYESALTRHVQDELRTMHPQTDAMGNVTVTFGSGAPHRLIAASLDEPGYVVSRIEPDGYLRLQRLPQTGLPPHYNEMQNAQPMTVLARDGHAVSAVTGGLSIHLTPGRKNVPDPDDLDAMVVDMGAKKAEDVRRSGVDLLSPVAAERTLWRVGPHGWAGTAVGDRYGAALLLQLARALSQAKEVRGTITVAFVTQQWAGSRGLTRLLQQLHPDELVYVGRGRSEVRTAAPGSAAGPAGQGSVTAASLGSGPVLYPASEASPTPAWFNAGTTLQPASAAPILQRGYGPAVALPARAVHLGVPLRYPLTAGEMLDNRDLNALLQAILRYAGLPAATQPAEVAGAAISFPPMPPRPASLPSNLDVLKTLSLSYGVSEQERMTREAVAALLPPWAHPETDAAGNLILHLGKNEGPDIAFLAHTDELGFRVKSIGTDGMLALDNKGGGSPAFYWGHPALVHTAAGSRAAVVALPPEFSTVAFQFPADFRSPAKLDVGATNAEEVAALGIHVGDSVTIPKRFHTLQDGRVSIRSLDDRVGCTALIHAVWALGSDFPRNVTFVWSTQEELGLLGAVAYAEGAARGPARGPGRSASPSASPGQQMPATVFAIDTFVSSDTPLESHRFADATLGDGFVIRAIDNSNVVPWKDVQRVEEIARQHRIPVQYGVTGGGNDGAAFQRYGATDVALSWPLRYSHSPAELIDARDLDALAAITEALAREW